jgi:hypothetical protein
VGKVVAEATAIVTGEGFKDCAEGGSAWTPLSVGLGSGWATGGPDEGVTLAETVVVAEVTEVAEVIGTGSGATLFGATTSLFWTKVLTAATFTSFFGVNGSTSLSKLWP